ncbi:RNA-directed DNA polymerase from mobile element jockey [Frankliniella fusca]|uniref:RNA-directed DNA polymerase from mobile element jockey n=1 Tax=Frankliniella fusca TaxID=407009 RepID=A0AAE1H970_9NEOP|nr:RNA-directed DNA polymerase from mobile element jockey [Frankliniella fusca]
MTRQSVSAVKEALREVLLEGGTINQLADSLFSVIEVRLKDVIAAAVQEQCEALENRVISAEKEIEKLRAANAKVNKLILSRTDELEQYNRRNSIRIFGVTEKEGEDVEQVVRDVFSCNLNYDLLSRAVCRMHRTGRPPPKQTTRGSGGAAEAPPPRPILVKFTSYGFRREVFALKKYLKGTRIVILEDLTKEPVYMAFHRGDVYNLHEYVRGISTKYPKNLKIVTINAQSLHNEAHFTEFHLTFVNSGIDVVCVSETFFKQNSETNIPGYKTLHVDRKNRGGGGVAVFVADHIPVTLLLSSDGDENVPEYILVNLGLPTGNVLLACMYRPPHICGLDAFIDNMYLYLPHFKHVILCGDLNARFGSQSDETALVNNTLQLCNVECLPFDNTYHTETCSSYLDVLASNSNNLVLDHGQTSAPGFSAHDLLYAVFDFCNPRPTKKKILYRDFKNINTVELLRDAEEQAWQDVYYQQDINGKVNTFNAILTGLFDKHAPIRSVNCKHNPQPWITPDIRKLLNARDKARMKFKATKNPSDRDKFVMLRNKAKQECRNAKIKHFHGIFENAKTSKDTWAAIRSLGIKKNGPPADTDLPVSPNELNQHYASVASVKDAELVSNTVKKYQGATRAPEGAFYFKYVKPEEIIEAVISPSEQCVP